MSEAVMLHNWLRRHNYQFQTNRKEVTPAQRKRLRKKGNRNRWYAFREGTDR
jgi:hypothetical protein